MITFFKDVASELKKLQIPTKKETYVTTITITIAVAVATVIVMFSDFVISNVIKLIFGL